MKFEAILLIILLGLVFTGISLAVGEIVSEEEPKVIDYSAKLLGISEGDFISVVYEIPKYSDEGVLGTEAFNVMIPKDVWGDCLGKQSKNFCLNDVVKPRLKERIMERIDAARVKEAEVKGTQPLEPVKISDTDIENLLTVDEKKGL